VKDFIDGLSDEDAAEVVAAMAQVRDEGLSAARHLRGEIYEVRAEGRDVAIRILFASEGKKGRVLLALEGFAKKTRKTPEQLIRLATKVD
jgi:phage-related protein